MGTWDSDGALPTEESSLDKEALQRQKSATKWSTSFFKQTANLLKIPRIQGNLGGGHVWFKNVGQCRYLSPLELINMLFAGY